MLTDDVQEILFKAVEEINLELQLEDRLTPAMDTILFGEGGRLDSIGLVTFVLLVEEKLQAKTSLPLSLSDDRAMSQRNSPFRSLRTLHAYITILLQESQEPEARR